MYSVTFSISLFFDLEDSCHERAFVNDRVGADGEEESVAGRDDTTENLTFERQYYLAYLIAICVLKTSLPMAAVRDLLQQAVAEREESVLYNEFCDLYEDTGRRVLEERAGDGLSRSSVILRSALRAQTEQTLAWMLAEPEMTEPKEKKHGSEKKSEKK